ncbi:carboxylating nicotinate-nucleotide diphosphorylase [bacterium]|nr:carboxylating nicotinate-nucleotide diphosphorylase [bacterium]MBU2461727.1 carboxylating nicotinate-nucleotide diphosphorylase [bacterium]
MKYELSNEDFAIIRMALTEDIGEGDITSASIIPKGFSVSCEIIAKEEGVLAGIDIAEAVFSEQDPKLKIDKEKRNGEILTSGDRVLQVSGEAREILCTERTALNFLQRLSGIATLTKKFVEAVSGRCKIYDTRKTTPALRRMEKYAIMAGGGGNHRFGLFDEILIKENHIAIACGIEEAIRRVREKHPKRFIEIETENLEEVKTAISCGVSRIMLDNFSLSEMKEAIRLIREAENIEIEVSGNIELSNIKEIAELAPDIISCGKLTHSLSSLDFSLKIL